MPAPQLPLALRYPPDQRLSTFTGAPAGALELVRALAEGEGDDWVFVVGPAGTGKTHVLLAACAAAESVGRSAAYLPLKSAAGRLRDALDAFDGMALVALDGVDAIAGNRDDEVALFDFHNRARQSGTRVLYAAQAAPDALSLVLPDLRSRLSQCARVVLSPLDDEARRDVLRARAQRRGLVLEDAAIDWLMKRKGRDLTSLTALLDVLDRASLAAQRKVTVPFLREALGEK